MKLLLKNWRKYLLTEQTTFWDYNIRPDQKVFLSSEPWTTFKPTLQVKPDYAGQKPKGLWYGCGDSWIEWIKLNMPGSFLEKANYLYEVKLGEEIIQISSDDEFDNFQSEFGFPLGKRGPAINWKEIQEQEYNGIEICPYNWERRMKSDWYYPWDVASGCIWNLSGVSDIVLLAEKGESNSETSTEDKSVSIKDVHELADTLNIPWDDNTEFMSWTKELTGKSHLDKMTREELSIIYAALKKRGKKTNETPT